MSFREPLSNDNKSIDLNQTYDYFVIGRTINISDIKLTKNELNKLFHLNIYKSLKLNLNKLPKNNNNIYNLYKDIIAQLK